MEFDRPIAIAVIFFVILILMFFLVVPKYNEFKDLQIELGEKKADFVAKYDYFSEITKVFYELENHKEGIKVIDDGLPDNPSFGRLFYFFQKKARENGLVVKDLLLAKYSPVSPGSNVKEIAFSINISGSYPALKNFIVSLEKSARLFEITSISFSSPTNSFLRPLQPSPKFQIQQTYSFKMEVKAHSY
ncbi:MAG: hypothetical protein HYT36_00155 [Candidatus Staskawiczbacteria bacterium]|nr:hypothetical protein [Candidatus Staskawiczbacteria bacterium]